MNGWVNNREVGELRRQRAHYDVIVIISLAVFRRTPLITSQRWFKHQAIIRANDNQVSCYYSSLHSSAGVAGSAWPETYRQTSSKSRTKYSNLNVSCFVLQLPLPSLLKPGIKSRMEMWLEQRRQTMLQHLSDQQFYCLLGCDLYQRFDFTCRDSVSMKNTTANIQIIFYQCLMEGMTHREHFAHRSWSEMQIFEIRPEFSYLFELIDDKIFAQ